MKRSSVIVLESDRVAGAATMITADASKKVLARIRNITAPALSPPLSPPPRTSNATAREPSPPIVKPQIGGKIPDCPCQKTGSMRCRRDPPDLHSSHHD